MSTRAVTPDAPAASTFESESHPHAEFLPTDKEYRLTGKLPEADTETGDTSQREETDKEKVEATRAHEDERGDDKSAAASEAAKSQKEPKEEKQQKTASTSESRWAKVTRENKELRERLQRLESANTQRDTKQESRPAAETKTDAKAEAKSDAKSAKPKIDDVDPETGKPKFATYQDYEDARDDYNRKEAIREFQESNQKSERERAQTEAEKIIEKTVTERVAKARETHADYDNTMKDVLAQKDEHGNDAFFYTKGSHIEGFFLDSDRGHDVMYEIAKNFGDHKHIFARDAQGRYLMNPVRQVRELAKIELALETAAAKVKTDETGDGKNSSSTSSAKPITQAPRPPHQTSGKGTVNKDAVVEAAEEGDFETYAREQNARDLARRKKGK